MVKRISAAGALQSPHVASTGQTASPHLTVVKAENMTGTQIQCEQKER